MLNTYHKTELGHSGVMNIGDKQRRKKTDYEHYNLGFKIQFTNIRNSNVYMLIMIIINLMIAFAPVIIHNKNPRLFDMGNFFFVEI